MSKRSLKKLYPGLPDKVARHVVARLRSLDWQQLQQIATRCCQDCPGYADPSGPPCDFCPLHPLALDAAILAAQTRSSQHDDDYLKSIKPDDEN